MQRPLEFSESYRISWVKMVLGFLHPQNCGPARSHHTVTQRGVPSCKAMQWPLLPDDTLALSLPSTSVSCSLHHIPQDGQGLLPQPSVRNQAVQRAHPPLCSTKTPHRARRLCCWSLYPIMSCLVKPRLSTAILYSKERSDQSKKLSRESIKFCSSKLTCRAQSVACIKAETNS